MKKSLLSLLFLGLPLLGQNVLQNVGAIVFTNQVPGSVQGVTAQAVGARGYSTYYYWIVAHYASGLVTTPSNVAIAYNANATLSGGNFVKISWIPNTGATTYDVLKTTSGVLANGNILLTNTASTSYSDTGTGLSSYTIASSTNPSICTAVYDAINNNPGVLNIPCLSLGSGVTSFNGRTGAVVPQVGDYSAFYPTLTANNTWTGNQMFNGSFALGTPLVTSSGGTGVNDFTFSGSTHKAATATGTLTANGCAQWNASGDLISTGASCGTGGGGGTPGGATNTVQYNNSGVFGGVGPGTTTTVLHGNASGAPSYGAITLTSDVSGILPIANGGNGTTTPTLTQGSNVTITGSWPNYTIAATSGSGVPTGTSVPATCSTGQTFGLTTATGSYGQFYWCTSSNTFVPFIQAGTSTGIVFTAPNIVDINTTVVPQLNLNNTFSGSNSFGGTTQVGNINISGTCTGCGSSNPVHIVDSSNQNVIVSGTAATTAVNQLTATNASTGGTPQLSATGTDTNIAFKLTGKGTGSVFLNGNSASVDAGGNLTVTSCIGCGGAGTPSLSAVTDPTGGKTFTYPANASQIWQFNGGATIIQDLNTTDGPTVAFQPTGGKQYNVTVGGTTSGLANSMYFTDATDGTYPLLLDGPHNRIGVCGTGAPNYDVSCVKTIGDAVFELSTADAGASHVTQVRMGSDNALYVPEVINHESGALSDVFAIFEQITNPSVSGFPLQISPTGDVSIGQASFTSIGGTLVSQANGHIYTQGIAPSVTGGTLDAHADDNDGVVTTSATSGTVTFHTAYGTWNHCTVTDQAHNTLVYSYTLSVITFSGNTSGDKLDYSCKGK